MSLILGSYRRDLSVEKATHKVPSSLSNPKKTEELWKNLLT